MEFSNPFFILVLLGVACYVCTLITRRIVETAVPKLVPKVISGEEALRGTELEGTKAAGTTQVYATPFARWWNKVILDSLAPLWGVFFGCLFHGEEYFPPEFKSWLVTVLVGLACGYFSGFLVKMIKKIFLDRVGATDEATLPSTSNT